MNAPTRRRVLAGVGAAATAGLAGCSGLTGPVTFAADSVAVSPDALSATGYGHYRTTTPVVTRTVSALGVEKRVEVTNVVAEYDRVVDLRVLGLGRYQAAVFAVLSTPQVRFLGQTFNPVADMSAAELATTLQQRYENLGELTPEGEFAVPVLGSETTVGRFSGRATLAGTGATVDVAVYVAEAVPAGGDFVVPVAAHPRVLDEREDVERLLGGVRDGE